MQLINIDENVILKWRLIFLPTLKCQSRELRGRVTVGEENCDKTARCTSSVSSVRTEGAGPCPENEKEGLTYQNGYFFRGLPSMLQ